MDTYKNTKIRQVLISRDKRQIRWSCFKETKWRQRHLRRHKKKDGTFWETWKEDINLYKDTKGRQECKSRDKTKTKDIKRQKENKVVLTRHKKKTWMYTKTQKQDKDIQEDTKKWGI